MEEALKLTPHLPTRRCISITYFKWSLGSSSESGPHKLPYFLD